MIANSHRSLKSFSDLKENDVINEKTVYIEFYFRLTNSTQDEV